MYLETSLANKTLMKTFDVSKGSNIDTGYNLNAIRASLGMPLNAMPQPTQCMVASVNGLDIATAKERFIVASRLWAEGLSCEYLAQSGLLSRFLQQGDDLQGTEFNDWCIEEFCGVCAIMKIPFVVIVQPHVLKEKGTVRLRSVLLNVGLVSTERIVLLDDLASTIKELLPATYTGHGDVLVYEQLGNSSQPQHKKFRDVNNRIDTSIECIYIQNNQYFDCERPVSNADTAQFKTAIKAIRGITQRAESFIRSMTNTNNFPVFVTGVSFWCLRDFNSNLMRKAEHCQCSNTACLDTISSYPTHKRSLKTLGAAIDSYMKRNGFWRGDNQTQKETIFLLYSKPDDRFDMVTLKC
jgi:hypothetical protein